jgi:hypothetical protein
MSFFAKGQLLRTYQIKDLVDNPGQLPHSVSHIWWRKDDRFDDGKLQYTVWTHDGNRFVFDVATGDIVSEIHFARVIPWVISGVIGLVLLIFLAWFFSRTRRRRLAVRKAGVSFEWPQDG